MMSRSRNVSLRRRALPASETSTAAGWSRSTDTTASSAPRPSPSRRRSEGACCFSASALRMRSSVLAPRPVSVRSCSCSAACLSSSTVVTPSSFQILAAVFGRPTYNERENLEAMLRALGDKGARVLVIDDSSPDGTGELADCLAEELDYVSVLHRPSKEGLGPAYLAGFRRALGDGAELVL